MGVFSGHYTSGFEVAGWGYGYTRPSRAWIGIDRILATAGSRFRWCEVGPRVGSDHRPMMAEVVLDVGGDRRAVGVPGASEAQQRP